MSKLLRNEETKWKTKSLLCQFDLTTNQFTG